MGERCFLKATIYVPAGSANSWHGLTKSNSDPKQTCAPLFPVVGHTKDISVWRGGMVVECGLDLQQELFWWIGKIDNCKSRRFLCSNRRLFCRINWNKANLQHHLQCVQNHIERLIFRRQNRWQMHRSAAALTTASTSAFALKLASPSGITVGIFISPNNKEKSVSDFWD